MKNSKKNVCMWVLLMLTMVVFVGCIGKKETGDKRFTYDWRAYSITSNGKTDYILKTDPVIPQFTSSDGKTCTFTNNGKAHTGTIEKKAENLYNIKLETNVVIEAEISEDTLTLLFNGGQITLVFKAD